MFRVDFCKLIQMLNLNLYILGFRHLICGVLTVLNKIVVHLNKDRVRSVTNEDEK